MKKKICLALVLCLVATMLCSCSDSPTTESFQPNSSNDYFITIDADSILKKDALINITDPIISDNNVVAVGGLIRISNGMKIQDGQVISYKFPKEMPVIIQNLEYDRTFLASRILFDAFNSNLIISGAFGLFKKGIVIAAGGYEPSTRGEDMELVIKIHTFCRANKIKYKID